MPSVDNAVHQNNVVHDSSGDIYSSRLTQMSTQSEVVEVRMDAKRSMFTSTLGSVMSCLGCAVGTGNIWRFPRILASQSYSQGALCFYMAWVMVLFVWSVPIVLTEYALGRFTQNSPLPTYQKFMGKYFIWIGGWIASVIFLISAYYPVVVGWCLYYFVISCTASSLPATEKEGLELFNNFAKYSYYPVLCQMATIVLTGLCTLGGIQKIEKANMVLVPLLLSILIFTFGWSMTRDYSALAMKFLFTPAWSSLANPSLFINAAAQNAFDTGAGMAVMFTYATYMDRSTKIVKYSLFIPLMNNLVSLYASFTIYATVFSTLIQDDPTITESAILKLMRDAGPGSTGLTFTSIPVLFSKVGIFGRILCALFFLCLSFAGISSLLAVLQVGVLCLKEITSHRVAVGTSLVACALFGLPSALKLEFLENQDNTWGTALIVSGFCFALIPICYRPWRFLKTVINDFGIDDWKVTIVWIPLIMVVVPAFCVSLIVWWIYDDVSNNPNWVTLSYQSVSTSLLSWFILLVILIGVNLIVVWRKKDIYPEASARGCDPRDPSTYEDEESYESYQMKDVNQDENPATTTLTLL